MIRTLINSSMNAAHFQLCYSPFVGKRLPVSLDAAMKMIMQKRSFALALARTLADLLLCVHLSAAFELPLITNGGYVR